MAGISHCQVGENQAPGATFGNETSKLDIYFPLLFFSHFQIKLATMAKTKASVTASKTKSKELCESTEPKGDGSGRSGKSCVIKGLAHEWFGIEEIRNRVLDGGPVMAEGTVVKHESIPNCVRNDALLEPILQRMCITEKRPLPSIDDLRDEVGTLLTLGKRHGEDLVTLVEETGQTIKKLCGFVKLKARRQEVSTATRFKKLSNDAASSCPIHFLCDLFQTNLDNRNVIFSCDMWSSTLIILGLQMCLENQC